MSPAPLYGLVLAGGQSRRMGQDKASLCYGKPLAPQWKVVAELMEALCQKVYISVRQNQSLAKLDDKWRERLLPDVIESAGPLTGILTAMDAFPNVAWIVVACDLPLLAEETLRKLIDNRGNHKAIAYRSTYDGLPEPLCSIYEPEMQAIFTNARKEGKPYPRKILINEGPQVKLLDLTIAEALDNANTPEDFAQLENRIRQENS